MWIFDTNTITVSVVARPHNFYKDEGYAILSHRWEESEITYLQMTAGGLRDTPQFVKTRRACETAKLHSLNWIWIDTCCINTYSATEVAESINSMFKWYRDAKICLAYLSDVKKVESSAASTPSKRDIFRRHAKRKDDIEKDESQGPSVWFSRGWTLQELLAPRRMQFYDTYWNELGTKSDLAQELEGTTKIDARYLREGGSHLSTACIVTKMSWMANRETTREEDMAYSMLGIFNVEMVPIYGEGEKKAFIRLRKVLLQSSSDESLFAWRMPEGLAGGTIPGWAPYEWGLLAAHPKWFEESHDITIKGPELHRRGGGFSETQNGIQMPVMPVIVRRRYTAAGLIPLLNVITIPVLGVCGYMANHKSKFADSYPLNCWRPTDKPENMERIVLYLGPTHPKGGAVRRYRCSEFAPDHKMPFVEYNLKSMNNYIARQPDNGYED